MIHDVLKFSCFCTSARDFPTQIKDEAESRFLFQDGLPGPERIAFTPRWPLPEAVIGRLCVGVALAARICIAGGDVGEVITWDPKCLNGSKGLEAAEVREAARVETEDTMLSPVSIPASRTTCHSRLFSCMAFAISSISASHLFW